MEPCNNLGLVTSTVALVGKMHWSPCWVELLVLEPVVVTNNPPSLFSISNNIKQRGTLNKNPKNIFIQIFVFNSLKAISHRKERVKSFPMRINKLQRSDVKFIASHILKAPLKRKNLRNRPPICDVAYRKCRKSSTQ